MSYHHQILNSCLLIFFIQSYQRQNFVLGSNFQKIQKPAASRHPCSLRNFIDKCPKNFSRISEEKQRIVGLAIQEMFNHIVLQCFHAHNSLTPSFLDFIRFRIYSFYVASLRQSDYCFLQRHQILLSYFPDLLAENFCPSGIAESFFRFFYFAPYHFFYFIRACQNFRQVLYFRFKLFQLFFNFRPFKFCQRG